MFGFATPPPTERDLVGLGAVLYRAYRLEEALEYLEKAEARLQVAKDDYVFSAPTYCFLAMTHHRLGNEDAASTYLNKATHSWGKESAARKTWYRRMSWRLLRDETTSLLKQKGSHLESDLARARDEAAETDEPFSYEVWRRLALIHYRTKNWVGAEEEAKLAMNWSAHRPANLSRIAPFFLLAGKNDEYHALCEKLVVRSEEWDSEGVTLLHVAALCSLDRLPPSDPSQLASLGQRAAKDGPKWSLKVMARVHCRLGEYEQAVSGFKEWIKERPNFPPYDMAIVHHLSGNANEARIWLDKAEQSYEEWSFPGPAARLDWEVLRQDARRLINSKSDPDSN